LSKVANLTDGSLPVVYVFSMDPKILALVGFVVLAAIVIAYFATR
jgi:hypothetical protein